jgi:ABC-type antimicrobial peptide transport system permease subunit
MTPPRLSKKLLHWFCDPKLLEDVEGDLDELFQARASRNAFKARLLYFVDVLLLFRPGIIRGYHHINNQNMLLNHIKTAMRQAGKYKGYTAINIAGLVVGLASCMLILLWVSDEVTKDQFHEKSDRIYQVWRNMIQDKGDIITTGGIPYPLEHVLQTQYPEVELVTSVSWEFENLFRVDEASAYLKGRYATKDFFNVFTFPLLIGDQSKVLQDKNSIVISDRTALSFFGIDWRKKALGQMIKIDERVEVAVSGVFTTPASNSSIAFDWIMPGQGYIDRNEWIQSWFNGGFAMFFSLREGANVTAVRERIAQEINRNTNNAANEPLFLQLFAENYLHGKMENGAPAGGRIQYVQILSAIAILILLIACINFMNLATARSSLRAREIGVRKVMGAFRSTLSQQFFVESMLYASVSTSLAILVAWLSLPYFNELTGKLLIINLADPVLWITIASIIVITGMLSGTYPAFMLSSLSISKSLKGRTRQSSGAYFRHALVTFQFAISIFLISGTIVITRQLEYILSKDIGLQRENLVVVDLIGDLVDKTDFYFNSLRSIPEIKDVTTTNSIPTAIGPSTGGAKWPGKDPNSVIEINVLSVGENFTTTMGMEIKKGEGFSNVWLRDSASFLINETLARIMGFDEPVGKELAMWGTTGTIIGVVKDFHMSSMYQPIGPVIIRYQPRDVSYAFIRIGGDLHSALTAIERVTKEANPAFPFRYAFLDDDFSNRYRSEESVSALVKVFAGVSIFIACLGLLGLSSFSADQRAKEIGVRKVHGASTTSLVLLLSKHYARLMIIAFAIAAPLSYFYMQQWLSDFAYRTNAGIQLFVLAGVITFAIGALTVSYRSYTAALTSPAKTLKED